MLETLIDIDKKFFFLINGANNAAMDFIMFWVSSKILWIPLYLFLLYLIIKEYKWNTLYILLMIAILITLSDQISTRVLKFGIERLRPCHEEAIKGMVHLVNGKCGGKFGFVSSHATNSFALAIYIGLLLRKKYNYLLFSLLLWASLIAYSRVYLGVHYPGDVIGGAALGVFLAFLVRYATNRIFRFSKIKN